MGKSKDMFVAEFDKDPEKIDVGEDGAVYVFEFKL